MKISDFERLPKELQEVMLKLHTCAKGLIEIEDIIQTLVPKVEVCADQTTVYGGSDDKTRESDTTVGGEG